MLALSAKKTANPNNAAPNMVSATSKPAPRRKTAPGAVAPEAAPKQDKSEAERVAAVDSKTSSCAANPLPEAAEVHTPKLQRTAKRERPLKLQSQAEAERPHARKAAFSLVEPPKLRAVQHEGPTTSRSACSHF